MPLNPDYAWLPNEYEALAITAQELMVSPADLLLVMDLESGGDPGAWNSAGAKGLIQITQGAAKVMGLTTEEYKNIEKLSIVDQLPLVRRYFESHAGKRQYPNATVAYLAVAAPGHMKFAEDPNHVLYAKGSAGYAGNPDLDTNKDGLITVGDLSAILSWASKRARYQGRLAELNNAIGAELVPTIGKVSETSPTIARAATSTSPWLWIALGVGGYYVWNRNKHK